MHFKLSNRLNNLPPYLFLEIDKAKRRAISEGKDIIDLGIGDPDQGSPREVVEALYKAAQDSSNHHYPLDEGIFDVPMVQLPNGEYNLTLQIGEWAKSKKLRIVEARFWHPVGYPEDVDRAHHYVGLSPEERVN